MPSGCAKRSRTRSTMQRDGIRDEPIRMTLYALGVGVIIGLWLRR